MTRLRKMMLEELERRNYSQHTIRHYIRTVGSTVNRELALLKRMFNLAIDWELFRDHNPVRKVKFFRELNTGTRVVSQEEEERLL